jgi:DNA-binding response OmpR family regulator
VFVLSRSGADVILCDDRLADGTWKDVLSVIAPLPELPRLIVLFDSASPAEWSEVLNLGGFDVLNKPLNEAEVTLTVAAAWRNLRDGQTETRRSAMWDREFQARPAPAASAAAGPLKSRSAIAG